MNVVVAGKQPSPQWLSMDEAVNHCERAGHLDMVVLIDMDRFHLVCDVIDGVSGLAEHVTVRQAMVDKRAEHKRYINEHGVDMPEILHWKRKRGSELIQPEQPSVSTPQKPKSEQVK